MLFGNVNLSVGRNQLARDTSASFSKLHPTAEQQDPRRAEVPSLSTTPKSPLCAALAFQNIWHLSGAKCHNQL